MFEKRNPLHILYWLIIAIFIFVFLFLLVKLFPFYRAVFSFVWKILAPFFIACLIAYLLNPIVQKLRSHNINKLVAILLIYFIFFGGGSYLIYRIYPIAIYQLQDFSEQLPGLLKMYEELIYNLYVSTSFLPEIVHDKMDQIILNIEKTMEGFIGKFLGDFDQIYELIIMVTVIPVLVFYFLKDYEKIKAYMKKFIPIKYHEETSKIFYEVDNSLGNYIRGQLLVSLFVSIMTFIVFHFLQMKYALLLAIIMGFTNFIPYFGPIIGAIPATAIALTMSPKIIIFVLIAIFVIQLIENNLLSPYIMGKSINIHPIAIIFALLLGGQISGIIGMVFAVPTLTIMKDISSHLYTIRRYN